MRPSPSPSSTSVSKACRSRPAARIPASTTAGDRASREASQVWRRCRGQEPAHVVAVRGTGVVRTTGGQGPGGGTARDDAGRDRVVDALPRHRVDQPGRVPGQQHRAVRLAPAPAAERQVVATPAACRRRRRRAPAPRAARAAAGGWAARAVARRRAAARRTRRWRGRRRGRRPRRTTAGAGRRTGSAGAPAAPAWSARSRGSRWRARLPAGAEERRADEGVRAVGADHHPRREPVDTRTGPPSAAGVTEVTRCRRSVAPAATARSTRRASRTSRGTTCTGRSIAPRPARRRGRARGRAAASSRPPRRRRRRWPARRARAARCRPRSDLSRGKSLRSSSSTRSDGSSARAPSAAAEPAGPAPTTTTSHASRSPAARPADGVASVEPARSRCRAVSRRPRRAGCAGRARPRPGRARCRWWRDGPLIQVSGRRRVEQRDRVGDVGDHLVGAHDAHVQVGHQADAPGGPGPAPWSSTIVPVSAMPTRAGGHHRVDARRARRRSRPSSDDGAAARPTAEPGRYDDRAPPASAAATGAPPTLVGARSGHRRRGSPRPARRTGRRRSSTGRTRSVAARAAAPAGSTPARAARTRPRISSRALVIVGLRRCASTRRGTTPRGGAGRSRAPVQRGAGTGQPAGRPATARAASYGRSGRARRPARPDARSAQPSRRASEKRPGRGLHRDRLGLGHGVAAVASTTCARRSTSTDGMSMRTGQTSKQAPHSDEA